MKQALRLLDYGWVLAFPEEAKYLWHEEEWPDDIYSQDDKEEYDNNCSDGQFLYQRILHDEKMPEVCDWDSIRIKSYTYNPYCRWGDILAHRPELAEHCPWEKLDKRGWTSILSEAPQFASLCDWNKLDGDSLCRILEVQPQLFSFCDPAKLKSKDWVWILYEQPQLAEHCDFSKFKGKDWAYLLNGQPQFADRCKWKKIKIRRTMIDLLRNTRDNTFRRPELVKYCDCGKFSSATWAMVSIGIPGNGIAMRALAGNYRI